MNKHAPLATLVSVVLLGAVLLVVTMLNTPTAPAPAAPVQAAAPAPAPAAPAPTTAAPTPVVAEKAYTGRSAGDEVTVAIAVKNGKAVAYVCDGRAVEAWLEGTLTGGGALRLQGRSSALTGTVTDRETLGEVTVNGRALPFAAKGVTAPAGLYQGRGVLKGLATRVGWVVGGDGSVTGVADVGGTPEPAPALDPRSLTAGGLAVTRVDGDATVVA